MVDANRIFRDISLVKHDELFCQFELHEKAKLVLKEKDTTLIGENK